MRLERNIPLNTAPIAELLKNKDDLYLVWPKAEYPFDHDQWKEVLNPDKGNVPFLIYEGDKLIGHAAICKTDDTETYSLNFLYIIPELRSQGLGEKMVKSLEQYARDNLGAKKLCLVVRTYNPRAMKCYKKCGFAELTREVTLMRMAKAL